MIVISHDSRLIVRTPVSAGASVKTKTNPTSVNRGSRLKGHVSSNRLPSLTGRLLDGKNRNRCA
ncbi:MAG: hypothetical protein WC452_09650 [Aminobacteriaceae bacterium]